jgi:hypothetical protein
MAPINQGTFEEGREAQFREMMDRFAEIHARYKGVRGELLAKVREELQSLKPAKAPKAPQQAAPVKATPPPAAPPAAKAAPLKVVTSPATSHMLP